MDPKLRPFHFAAPIKDKEAVRKFYVNLLGCHVGREAESWIDLNFFGHQVSFHVKPEGLTSDGPTSPVDGKQVPVRHFGVVLDWDDWHTLSQRLTDHDTDFVIDPYIRFEGEVGEQATMFFYDPTGHALEFKSFKDPSQLFAN